MAGRKNRGCLARMFGALFVCVAAVVVAVLLTNAVVVGVGYSSIKTAEEASQYDADAIVVLGASVLPDGTPSPILKDRIDDGINLYFAGAAPKIIMSGDHGTDSYNEVQAMKQYAIEQGVPSDDIFCDHAGFSTYESMYRAKSVFGVQRVVIATQTYHLYRAIYSARVLGMEAIGVPSDYRSYEGQLFNDAREVLARSKDFFVALLHLPPTFGGDSISLDQSGDVTG